MFQSLKFKTLIGLSFMANLEVVCLNRAVSEYSISNIGVQILTIEEISLLVFQN